MAHVNFKISVGFEFDFKLDFNINPIRIGFEFVDFKFNCAQSYLKTCFNDYHFIFKMVSLHNDVMMKH